MGKLSQKAFVEGTEEAIVAGGCIDSRCVLQRCQ
jgi:hypothetical protein